MRQRRRNARVGQEFALIDERQAVGLVLDDLDGAAVGVGDKVVRVADPPLGRFVGHFDPLRGEILAHLLGIVGLQRHVVQPVGAGLLFREQLDRLPVIDFDECEAQRAVVILQGIRLVKSKEVFVERA